MPKSPMRWLQVALVFAFITLPAAATTRYFSGPGNFSDSNRWDNNVLPLPADGDDIVIINSCTFDDSRDLSYGSLTLGNGGSTSGSVAWALFDIDRLSVTSITSTVS